MPSSTMYGLNTMDPFQMGIEDTEQSAMVFDEYDDSTDTSVYLDKNHGFGPIPEKRQKRAAYVSIGLSFIIMVVLLGTFTKPKDELYVIESNTSMLSEDEMFCKQSDKSYHVGIFIWSLNLIGIILGEFVNRLCLMFEEYFHLYTRYNGSKRKMFSACFNDISFRAVFFAAIVAFIIIGSTLLSQGTKYFKFEYIEIILSGVGSSTLVLYLLSLDTLSRVQISSLLENNNRLVANGLAWSYYFGYLRLILPKLPERIKASGWNGRLSSNKLFILMPRDCWAYGNLSEEAMEGSIELAENGVIECEAERAGIARRSFRNNVYRITVEDSDTPLYILAEYATPLCSMYDMSHSAEANLSVEDRDGQVKLFLRTLKAILSNPCVPEVRNRCKLVPYARGENAADLTRILAEAVLDDNRPNLDYLDGIERENDEEHCVS